MRRLPPFATPHANISYVSIGSESGSVYHGGGALFGMRTYYRSARSRDSFILRTAAPLLVLFFAMICLTVALPAQQQAAPVENSGYVIHSRVNEVLLQVSVFDGKHHTVPTLRRQDFKVFEDGKPQQVVFFRSEEVPVSLAIVIDNSASMAASREEVNKAALALVKASNPQDEVFVVNFTDKAYLDQDFTAEIGLLEKALNHISTMGSTALYDSLVAASEHLVKAGARDRKAIVVITDGEDNASISTLEDAMRKISVDGGPAIYAIGLQGDGKERVARKVLAQLAQQTGGEAFFPESLSAVDGIMRGVAYDLRNQYVLGYKPATPITGSGYRSVKVTVTAHGHKHLQVRTRAGYYAKVTSEPAR